MRNVLSCLACLSLLTGCTVTPTGGRELTASGKVVLKEMTTIGVRRFVADHPNILARTAKIRVVVQDIQDRTKSLVTLTDLHAAVIKEIDAGVGNKIDHDDLVSLANMLHALALDYVGQDKLDEKALVRVNEYLGFILAALPA